jgi:glycosyltransferase involved in cell wall biosynthesis
VTEQVHSDRHQFDAMLAELRSMRVALVHDWLVTLRGGERVLDGFCELFPQAPIHTLVRVPGCATPRIEAMEHISSFADRVPMARTRHRWLLPLYPSAIESFDLSDYDLILSSSHCVAKAVIPAPGAIHVCYSHTPVRYAWDRTADYISGSSPLLVLARPALVAAATWLRRFDASTLPRVDRFVANSRNTADKIRRFYDREAIVVPPPVEFDRFTGLERKNPSYDLVLSGLVPYKRVDMAIDAYRLLPNRRLVVVGGGPEFERLNRNKPDNVEMTGRVPEEALAGWYCGAQLLIFPGEEDFGIVPLEAQACGVPVVAFRKGGALESVVENKTGHFFDQPTPVALAAAIEEAAVMPWSEADCRANANRFARQTFLEQIVRAVHQTCTASPARQRRMRLQARTNTGVGGER